MSKYAHLKQECDHETTAVLLCCFKLRQHALEGRHTTAVVLQYYVTHFEFPSTTDARECSTIDCNVRQCAGVAAGFYYCQGVILTVNIMPEISRTHLRHINSLELALNTQVTCHMGTKQTQSTP